MTPERKFVRKNGDKVEEFIWGRKLVVYINNFATEETFNQVLDRWNKEDNPSIMKEVMEAIKPNAD